MKSNEDLLKEYQMKSCTFILPRVTYSKIGIKCSAFSTESGVKLSCHLKQEDTNTFSLRIKRNKYDDFSDDNQPKRRNVPTPKEQPKGY